MDARNGVWNKALYGKSDGVKGKNTGRCRAWEYWQRSDSASKRPGYECGRLEPFYDGCKKLLP